MKKKAILIFILAVLFVNLYFIYAAHIITPSSFSKTPNVSSQYNITINNTDISSDANITQVNITIPSSFTFMSGTNGTNSVGIFQNTTTVLSWTNPSPEYLINISLWRSFWFNANASQFGNYNFTITAVNSSGSYDYNISVTIEDTTDPSISFTNITPSSGSVLQQSYIPVGTNASDDVAVDTITIYLFNSSSLLNTTRIKNSSVSLNFTNLANGIYYVNASVNDTSNNLDSTTTRTITLGNTTCTPNWNYTSWSSCTNGTQTRNVTDLNNCGVLTGKPSTNQTCTETTCLPNWRCTEFVPEGECPQNETRTRTCADINNCDPNNLTRSETKACVFEEGSAKTFVIVISSIIALAIFGILGSWFYVKNKSEDGTMAGDTINMSSIPPETPSELPGNIYQPQPKPVFMSQPRVYGAPVRRPIQPYPRLPQTNFVPRSPL